MEDTEKKSISMGLWPADCSGLIFSAGWAREGACGPGPSDVDGFSVP